MSLSDQSYITSPTVSGWSLPSCCGMQGYVSSSPVTSFTKMPGICLLVKQVYIECTFMSF